MHDLIGINLGDDRGRRVLGNGDHKAGLGGCQPEVRGDSACAAAVEQSVDDAGRVGLAGQQRQRLVDSANGTGVPAEAAEPLGGL